MQAAGARRRKLPAHNRLELKGKKFGRLFILGAADEKIKGRNRWWNCLCDCGSNTKTTSHALRSGKTKSCGCLRHERYRWRGCGDISADYWYSQKTHAKNRRREFLITIEEAWSLFQKQEGNCAYTGLPLVFQRGKLVKQTASLDRIDSAGGYVPHNLQWVHKDVNRLKGTFPHERFLEICRLVAEQQRRCGKAS